MKWMVLSLLVLAMLAPVATAADVSGKWVSEMKTPDGQVRTSTFEFKADGEKLTGTVGGSRGSAEISDGKISGDDISFVVVRKFQEREVKMQYKGKVSGDEIKFNVNFGGDRSFDFVAKKAS